MSATEYKAGAGESAGNAAGESGSVQATDITKNEGSVDHVADAQIVDEEKGRRRKRGNRRWLLAAVSAVALTLLTIAGIRLVTKPDAMIDQLVILTVPSGAEITFDSQQLGHSPVKLEDIRVGTHKLVVSKDGFDTIEQEITIYEPQTLDFKLKPLPPKEAIGLSPEEQIKQYQQRAEESFARGDYAIPYNESALNYTDLIQNLDESNQFAAEMRERIRKALHQAAQTAITRADLAQAQEVYSVILDYFPKDEAARAGASKVEGLLGARRGEVRDLVKKAEEALQADRLTDSKGAYFYSKQALAIDKQNSQARAIRNQVKERLVSLIEQASARGDLDSAMRQATQAVHLFPEDKQLRLRLSQLQSSREVEPVKVVDPSARRIQGLEKYRRDEFQDAIQDLEFAVEHGRGTPDVIFALGRSYQRLGQLDRAASYFKRVPQSADDAYVSAVAALGDISAEKGNQGAALDRYREARSLGGSTLYSIAILDDRIERIEKRQKEKAAEPSPISISVRHLHGGLLGRSCTGTLSVSSSGVRYDGSEHTFSSNLVGLGVRINKDEMNVSFQGKPERFKASRADEERFRDMLSRYQAAAGH